MIEISISNMIELLLCECQVIDEIKFMIIYSQVLYKICILI